MEKAAFYLLLALVVAGTLILARGTRSHTDIKGAVFYAGACALPAVLAWAYARRGRARAPKEALWFLAAAGMYLAFTAASALWARHPWIVWFVVADRAMMLALAATAALLALDAARWRTLAGTYVVLGAVTACSSLVYHWGTRTFHDVRFPMGNANLLAAFLLIAIALTAAFLWRELRGERRPALMAALAGAAAVMVTVFLLCRPVSYVIGMGVAAVIFAALRDRRRAGAIIATATLVAAMGFGLAWKQGLVERFKHTKSYIVRAELWRRAWRMTEEKPLAGWGAGNYFTDSQPYIAEAALEEVTYMEGGALKRQPLWDALPSADSNAHNEYLHQTAEGGAAGLVLYLAIIATVAAAGLRARKSFAEPILLDGALAAFGALLVTNIMNPEVHFPEFAAHFWILAGIIVGAAGAAGAGGADLKHPPRAVLTVSALILSAAAIFGIAVYSVGDYRASQAFFRGEALQEKVRRDARTLSRTTVQAIYGAAGKEYERAAEGTRHQVLRIRALYAEGASYAAAGEMQKAIEAFEELAGDINSLYDTHYQLGRLYERVGKYEKALEHYERYSATHPEDLHPEDKTPAERLRSRMEGGGAEDLGEGVNRR